MRGISQQGYSFKALDIKVLDADNDYFARRYRSQNSRLAFWKCEPW